MPGPRDFDRDEYGEPRRRAGGNTGLVVAGCAVAGLLALGAAGAAAWFLWGGETTAEVTERYRPRFAEHRAKLKRVAGKLPEAGSVRGDALPADLDPKPVYDAAGKTFNTTALMAAQCEDPDRDPKTPDEFDLRLTDDWFLTHLKWTGDRSPMAESARKSPAKDLAEKFERSLGLRYLVVARPVRYDPPRVVDEKTFTGCELDLEVFLVDYPAEAVVGSFRRSFRPDPRVMVSFRSDRKESESAEAFVYSNMWSKARAEVAATLARGTGGTFVTDKK